MYRHRTDEFAHARKLKHDATRIERTKLERRLEKLIHLHFPVPDNEQTEQKKLSIERRKSVFDLDLASLRNMDPSDIWKGVIQSQVLQGNKADTRGVLSFCHSLATHPSRLFSRRAAHRTLARRRQRF